MLCRRKKALKKRGCSAEDLRVELRVQAAAGLVVFSLPEACHCGVRFARPSERSGVSSGLVCGI